jgi:hypothetical protein
MTSSSKPADTTAPTQTTTGSATSTEASPPTQTAAARTAAEGGDTGIISPEIGEAAFTEDDLAEIEQADSPYYQLSSRITQLLGEREIVAALGNTERAYAVDKELGEMRRVWDDRDTTDEQGTPPEGRQTRRERQIRTGSGAAASAPPPQRPALATSTTAAGTTTPGEDTATTPTTASTTAAKTPPASTATSTAATPTTTGGSEAKP